MRSSLVLPVVVVVAAACAPPAPPPAAEPAPCVAADALASLQPVDAADVAVHLDPGDDVEARALRADLQRVLGGLWGEAPPIVDGAPDGARKAAIWISTSADALAAAGDVPEDGHALKRIDDGDRATIVVAARDRRNLAHGTYALLEELGARFFHPRHELIPPLDGPRLPTALDRQRSSPFELRGTQLHTLHPLEYNPALLSDDPADLRDAELFVDWLLKTGQNHLQWFLMKTIPTPQWQARAAEIAAYAHARGVTVGAVVHLWEGASLQNGYSLLVEDTDGFPELEARIDEIMVVPFDGIELGLGEFLANDPAQILEWLNHATAYVADTYPTTTLSIVNHVGNYPELYVELDGEELFYYHVPGRADPRLVNTVHTVYWYDLYRPQGAYGHEDFFLQREFLFEELAERRVRYMPESAYWVSADIDVPAFLPEYLKGRHLDIQGLARDPQERGLPPLDGHVMYSSGHEWGYWLTDYLAARMLWEPEAPLSSFLGVFAAPFGACAADVGGGLERFIDLQDRVLFEGKLIPYVAAEDLHDDLGAAAGYVTIPARVPFETVRGMDDAARAAFDRDVVQALDAAADEAQEIEDDVAARCARADETLAPWCDELVDGIAVTKLRMRHSALLYRAVLQAVAGDDGHEATFAAAQAVTDEAAVVIARREQGYRFDAPLLAAEFDNETRYEFGLLHQASTQCLWRRQEDQVAFLLENGQPISPFELRTCQD